MDSTYLKNNVLAALSEALTAMAVQTPEDSVDFLGHYLLAHVERKQRFENEKKQLAELEEKLLVKIKDDEIKAKVEAEKALPKLTMDNAYSAFLQSIPTFPTKDKALQKAVNFIEASLNIPSAYVAYKEPSGESEVLKYVWAGKKSRHVVGKKLPRPSGEEGEDAPERQGVSFEAFKLPEVPEEEAAEEAAPEGEEGEGGEATKPPPKGPPKPSPLNIVNTMRDKRVKFFTVPKLGAYVACPFIYSSYEHDAAVTFTPAEGENPASFSLVKKDTAFLIGIDTIGNYRQIQKTEVERVMAIGEAIVAFIIEKDAASAQSTLEYVQGEELGQFNVLVTSTFAQMAEEEAAALAALVPPPAEPVEGAEPPAPVEGAELIKAKDDAKAVLQVWQKKIGETLTDGFLTLQKFTLPLPGAALKLFYALSSLLNLPPESMEDVCGDLNWQVLSAKALIFLTALMAQFDPTAEVAPRSKINTLAAVKAFVEANNVLDASAYPTYFPFFSTLLLPFLQKAIAAREAAITCSLEVNKVNLEAV